MIRTPQLWTKFYESLAFLFYSLAYCDGNIRKEEVAAVKELVQQAWLDFEPSLDEYGYDAAYQLEAVFDWLLERQPTAAVAFRRFNSFVKEHPSFIDQKIAENIFRSASQLVASYAGKNKSELGFLYLLQDILQETKFLNTSPSN
ncbi:MAG TPA: hypothetical protein VN040_04300 [Pseudosphingobacterium sp.]|nr:hypothetical protein [Pseudosphingobacterium sp.]